MQRTLLVCSLAVVTVGMAAEAAAQSDRRAVARAPVVRRLTLSPQRPAAEQQFTFSLEGSDIVSRLVEVVFIGPGCDPCVVPNDALTVKKDDEVVGPATLNTAGQYQIALRHGSTGALSNRAAISVSPGGGGSTGSGDVSGLSLSSISTLPAAPAVAQSFEFTLSGRNFNRNGTEVVITGPGCNPCVVPGNAMGTRTATRLAGRATLNQPGVYTIALRDASNGSLSRGLQITVAGPPPSISEATTSPQRPRVGQPFTFRVNGSNIDAQSVQVVLTGPGCSPCVVPPGDIDAVTSTRVVGQATLDNPGTYQLALRHGAASPLSAPTQITVGGGGGGGGSRGGRAVSLFRITTMPGNPRAGQTFNFRLNGDGFDRNSVQVLVSGPGCSPCVLGTDALSFDNEGRLIGQATLNNPGRYQFAARNGQNGQVSEGLEMNVR